MGRNVRNERVEKTNIDHKMANQWYVFLSFKNSGSFYFVTMKQFHVFAPLQGKRRLKIEMVIFSFHLWLRKVFLADKNLEKEIFLKQFQVRKL